MIDRALEQISASDLAALVAHQVSEGPTLDFKEAFPSPDHRGVRNFLADVTAFANSDGGDLVIGMREDGNGVAAELVGIDSAGLDEGLRRLDDQLRSLVDPRVPYFRVQTIALEDGRVALVMRVGASLIAPHRVTHEGSSRFYRRANRNNFEMGTAELRQAFAASNDLPDRIRALHHKAVEAIEGLDMPCRIQEGPTAVLTIAPLSVLREARDIPVDREHAVLPPLIMGGFDYVIGLDRLIVQVGLDMEKSGARSWSVNHRLGYLDFAWSIGRVHMDNRIVWPKNFSDGLYDAVRSSTARLREYGIEGPWIVMATLTGVQNFRLSLGDHFLSNPAWQDPAYLGEIIDDALQPDTLQTFVDRFWRLFGVERPPTARP